LEGVSVSELLYVPFEVVEIKKFAGAVIVAFPTRLLPYKINDCSTAGVVPLV
jgi:hypothetical protein